MTVLWGFFVNITHILCMRSVEYTNSVYCIYVAVPVMLYFAIMCICSPF